MNYSTKHHTLRYILLSATTIFLSASAFDKEKQNEEFDKKSAHAEHTLAEYIGTVNSFMFSPSSAFIASAAGTHVELRKTGQNKSLQQHDRDLNRTDESALLHLVDKGGQRCDPQPPALAVTWSPNGILYAAAFDHRTCIKHPGHTKDKTAGNVVIRYAKDGDVFRVLPAKKVRSLAYNPQDSSCLAVGTDDNNVEIWLPRDEFCIYRLLGHTAPVTQVEWNNDGTMLVSQSSNQQVKVWDAINGTLKREVPYGISSVGIINKNNLLSGSNYGTVDIWDMFTTDCIKTLPVDDKTAIVTSVAATADNIYIAAALSNNTVKVFDTATNTCVKTIPFKTTVGKVAWKPYDTTNQLAVAVGNTIEFFPLSITSTTDAADTPSTHQPTVFKAPSSKAEYLRYQACLVMVHDISNWAYCGKHYEVPTDKIWLRYCDLQKLAGAYDDTLCLESGELPTESTLASRSVLNLYAVVRCTAYNKQANLRQIELIKKYKSATS